MCPLRLAGRSAHSADDRLPQGKSMREPLIGTVYLLYIWGPKKPSPTQECGVFYIFDLSFLWRGRCRGPSM